MLYSENKIDKTCKLWNAENGQLIHTFRGHATEIVCLCFNTAGTVVATGSMDNTARLWDVETGGTHACMKYTIVYMYSSINAYIHNNIL